ncbi:MAG: hypothetical protein AAB967_04410, partial [Patescibacteria group bacterium]
MNSKKFFYLFLLIFALALAASLLIYNFYFKSGLSALQGGLFGGGTGKDANTSPAEPQVLYWTDKNSFFVLCKNLPLATIDLKAFRTLPGGAWEEWKEKIFPACRERAVEIKLQGEKNASYLYYFEASSESGDMLWRSS